MIIHFDKELHKIDPVNIDADGIGYTKITGMPAQEFVITEDTPIVDEGVYLVSDVVFDQDGIYTGTYTYADGDEEYTVPTSGSYFEESGCVVFFIEIDGNDYMVAESGNNLEGSGIDGTIVVSSLEGTIAIKLAVDATREEIVHEIDCKYLPDDLMDRLELLERIVEGMSLKTDSGGNLYLDKTPVDPDSSPD